VCVATHFIAAAGPHAQARAEQTVRDRSSCADEDGCLLSSDTDDHQAVRTAR
jgi:hypothetical protein